MLHVTAALKFAFLLTLMGTTVISQVPKAHARSLFPHHKESLQIFHLQKRYSSILSPFHSIFTNWISIFVKLNVVDQKFFCLYMSKD